MVDKDGHTPLHIAAVVGDGRAISLLLDRDARIDAIDKVCIILKCAFWVRFRLILCCFGQDLKSCFKAYLLFLG